MMPDNLKKWARRWASVISIITGAAVLFGAAFSMYSWADERFVTQAQILVASAGAADTHRRQAASQKYDFYESKAAMLRMELRYLLQRSPGTRTIMEDLRIDEIKEELPIHTRGQQKALQELRRAD